MFTFWKSASVHSAIRQSPPAAYTVQAAFLTDLGCQREVNEDAVRCVSPQDATMAAEKGWLAVVADGMGGHAAGEVASRLAVEVVARVYYDHAGEPQPALSEALVAANHAIYAAARRDASLHGMGTTCTALALRQGAAFLAHVGDSRLYLVRGGEIYQLSEDHSAVAEMLRRGLLSAQEAREHAERNVILRALGTHAEVNVTTWEQGFPVRAGDCFLLCSDGLSDLVADEEIRHAVESAEAAQSCARLIALARERGGHDNITVALLSLGRSTTEWHSLKSVPIDHQGAQPEVCAAVEWKVAR